MNLRFDFYENQVNWTGPERSAARQRLGLRQSSAAVPSFRPSQSGRGLPQSKTSRPFVNPCLQGSSALTLLEMMVAVTLLAVIMVGLLAMFNQTQKALHIANSQTDIFENGRGAMQMIVRDLAEMVAYADTNVISSYGFVYPRGRLTLPATNLPVGFSETFWLARANDDWQGIGYFVADDSTLPGNDGAGTLYRFSTNSPGRIGVSESRVGAVDPRDPDDHGALLNMFLQADLTATNQVRRVSDGIVHFAVTATYVTNTGPATNPVLSFIRNSNFKFPTTDQTFTTNGVPSIVVIELPAYVDVELGVLEPATLKQFENLRSVNVASAKKFLADHAEKIHFLRERVPIRNFVNPYRAHEVP